MVAKPIKPDTLSIRSLFPANQIHKVPRYQRDYSWEAHDHVEDLFSDFSEAYEKYRESNYFLGQIIVCPSNDEVLEVGNKQVFDIIDGQQRLTTIFLYLWTALDLLGANWLEDSGTQKWEFDQLKNSLASPNARNPEKFFPAIMPPKPGVPFVVALVNGDLADFHKTGAPTESRLVAAHSRLEELFLESQKQFGWDYLWDLVEWVADNVYLFRLETDSQDEALRHFLRLNDRGMNLEQVDIVKSLIFENVPENGELDHDSIDDVWNESATILTHARLKRLRNMSALLKFLIGAKTGKFVPTNAGTFADEWKKILEQDGEVESLLNQLPLKAKAVVDLSKGEGSHPIKYDPDLTIGTRERSATQQIEMLLAADQLSRQSFEKLLSVLEDRILLSTWGPEPSRDLEPEIHKWSKQLLVMNRQSTTPQDIVDFALTWYPDGNFRKFAADSLDAALSEWSYLKQAQQGRIRYFLARVNRLVDSAFDSSASDRKLASYLEKGTAKQVGVHLDHIFPKDSRNDKDWEQSKELDKRLGSESRKALRVNSVGNLALLYRLDNFEAGSELPWSEKKKKIYSGSSQFLQKALAGDAWRGSDWVNKKYTKLIDFLGVNLNDWSEQAVIKMTENYKYLMIHDMARNLGLDSDLEDWLEPLSD